MTEEQEKLVEIAVGKELKVWLEARKNSIKDGDLIGLVKQLNRAAATAFNRRPQPPGGNAA